MSVDMCVDMCIDMRIDMCIDICLNMHVDIYIDMCIDMCIDVCINMSALLMPVLMHHTCMLHSAIRTFHAVGSPLLEYNAVSLEKEWKDAINFLWQVHVHWNQIFGSMMRECVHRRKMTGLIG